MSDRPQVSVESVDTGEDGVSARGVAVVLDAGFPRDRLGG